MPHNTEHGKPRRLWMERQIFLRSGDKVRFINVPPLAQLALAGGVTALFGWMLLATLGGETPQTRLALAPVPAVETTAAPTQEIPAADIRDLRLRMEDMRGDFFAAIDTLETRQKRLRVSLETHHPLERILDLPDAPAGVRLPGAAPPNSNRLFALESGMPPPPLQSRIRPVSPDLAAAAVAPTQNLAATQGGYGAYARLRRVADAPAPAQSTQAWAREAMEEMRASADATLREMDLEQSHLLATTEEWMEEDIARLEGILAIVDMPVPPAAPPRRQHPAPPANLSGAGGPFLPDIPAETTAAGDDASPAANLQLARIAARLKRLNQLRDMVSALPLALPIAGDQFRLSSGYGMRNDPFSGERAFHAGLDFAAPWKSPALATAPGTVIRVGWSGPYGRIVDVDHGNGVVTRYGHLAEFMVAQGDEVAAGQPIGLVGSSGRSTGAHLHYEVRVGTRAQNPWRFLKAGRYAAQG